MTLNDEYQDVLRFIGRLTGWGRDPSVWEEEQRVDAEDFIRAGIRQFILAPPVMGEKTPHQWSFLFDSATITTSAAYTTGTVAVASGVVTLTSGTWPSWAASGELTVSGQTYAVSTRDSNSQITLVDTTVTVSSGTTYSLGRPNYDLATDFGTLEGQFTYRPGTNVLYGPVETWAEWRLRDMRQASDYTGRPSRASIRGKDYAATTDGPRYEVVFWPTPDDAYVLSYRYRINPDTITLTNKYAPGGSPHAETIKASILAVTEAEINDIVDGSWNKRFMTLLAASVAYDRRVGTPQRLGPDALRREVTSEGRVDWHEYDANYVTYNGTIPTD